MIVKFRVGEQENQVEAHLRRATREKREAQLRSHRAKCERGTSVPKAKAGGAPAENPRRLTGFSLVSSVVQKNQGGYWFLSTPPCIFLGAK
jgi:hypothetical protein